MGADKTGYPLISFVIVSRDETPVILQATLDGILETSRAYSIEMIVVDDGSHEPVRLDQPEIKLVRHALPIGTCRSRREGASLAQGEVLVSLDAHMSFGPGWLEEMLAHVDSGSLLCAAWWTYELTRPLCWGADFVWCGGRDYWAGISPGFNFQHRTIFPGEGAVEVPMLIGACYMMLRASYNRLGGFSPFFRTWGKLEQDLSLRAWICGLGVKCIPGAHVGHYSRSKFPYPVRWEDIEFNQAAIVRTVFEEPVARAIERVMHPLPSEVETWLQEEDFREWRRLVQEQRRISDAEFFERFVPGAPESLVRTAREVRLLRDWGETQAI